MNSIGGHMVEVYSSIGLVMLRVTIHCVPNHFVEEKNSMLSQCCMHEDVLRLFKSSNTR